MQCFWKSNSMVLVIAYCVYWSGDIFVTASVSDIKDLGNEDPLSIPLINDKGAPLVAMLDTNTINRKIKVYIRTLMRETIQNAVQEQIQDIFKTSFDENSTINFIRNMTMQGINDILKEQGQVKLLDSIRNEGVKKAQKSFDEDLKVEDIMYELQEKCLHDNQDISTKQLKTDTQNILKNVVLFNEIVQLNEQVIDGIKGILKLKESGGKQLVTRLLKMLTKDVKRDNMAYHNGMKFSTIDQDNDENAGTAYVTSYGPWWHKNCCYSGLNRKFSKNLYWSGQSPKTSVMMIRKLQ
ncbi:unnamed protein product [Mytilus edulis]|uniref:Fibrinogen C-terminal domain-containing protein n=1 Tax=Mytilus edulis TaxID=6550 RepID=A0A8S3VEA8_MYTED|nr:unnamed protein product [Mytilus edulis]